MWAQIKWEECCELDYLNCGTCLAMRGAETMRGQGAITEKGKQKQRYRVDQTKSSC
jgi:hypothetical protein